jgi:hypothetical protein
MKIVVLDLDETLGYFSQFSILWNCLRLYHEKNNLRELKQTDFFSLLDLFPEFLRPNIIKVLRFLKNKKCSKYCHKILIYTNNNGTNEWTKNIISYFETKIEYKLIDQIIGAFKIDGKKIELCRTTYNKTHGDLIRCTKLPNNTEICFLDDMYHPYMKHENVYYINIKPYYYPISFEILINRIFELYPELNSNDFTSYMTNKIKDYHFDIVEKEKQDHEIDIILSKRILSHLQNFFNKYNKNKTRKHKYGHNITFKHKPIV